MVHGWQGLRVLRHPELGTRLRAACDVPDLTLLARPGVRTVRFEAMLESSLMQLALWSMAALTRGGVLRSWRRVAGPLLRASRWLDVCGGETGGMHVTVAGAGHDGAWRSAAWYPTAFDNHGPEVPAMPAILLARELADGSLHARGARPCMDLYSLVDLEALCGRWNMRCGVVERAA